jgi:hypothetical protein
MKESRRYFMLGIQLERKVATSSVRQMGAAFICVEAAEDGGLQGISNGSTSPAADDNAGVETLVRGSLLPDRIVGTDSRV